MISFFFERILKKFKSSSGSSVWMRREAFSVNDEMSAACCFDWSTDNDDCNIAPMRSGSIEMVRRKVWLISLISNDIFPETGSCLTFFCHNYNALYSLVRPYPGHCFFYFARSIRSHGDLYQWLQWEELAHYSRRRCIGGGVELFETAFQRAFLKQKKRKR